MGLITSNPYFASCDELQAEVKGRPYSMDGKRSYNRAFLVKCKLKGMSPYAVARCPGVPIGASFYVSANGSEWDALALLVSKDAEPMVKEEGEYDLWKVTCVYSTELPGGQPQSDKNKDNPENDKPKVSWDYETIKVARRWDATGKPLLNSAHMPFMPAVTFDTAVAVLNITRNELGFDSEVAAMYSYAVNSDTFLGRPPGAVQCTPPGAEQVWRGKWMFWSVRYKIRFAPRIPNPENPDAVRDNDYIYIPWQPRLLDEGMHHLDTCTTSPKLGKPIPIFDHGPLHHPVLLDGAGQRATESPPTPRYIDFVMYPATSFNRLIVQGLA